MISLEKMAGRAMEIGFRKKSEGAYKILLPFYHEDGDMYDVYLEMPLDGSETLRITDRGLTLMKLSYATDISAKTKKKMIAAIAAQNNVAVDNGEIFIESTRSAFQQALYPFMQAIIKVSGLDELSKETVKSMFYEMFVDFVESSFMDRGLTRDYAPIESDNNLKVDFMIASNKPVFLFGVRDKTKASKVIISCLNFQQSNIPFRSLVVHDNFEKLDSFNKKQITNISDKQFCTLDDFVRDGASYVRREIGA